MKSKLLVILTTLVMALGLMAQSATQITPPSAGEQARSCACRNPDNLDGKMACCRTDGGCCKDDKGCMMSKDGKDIMTHEHMMSGDEKAANKCPVMAKENNGKMSCCGKGWQLLQGRQMQYGQGRKGLLQRQAVRTSANRSVTLEGNEHAPIAMVGALQLKLRAASLPPFTNYPLFTIQ